MNDLKNLFNGNNAFMFLCCKKCGKALNKNNTAMYRNKYYCKECRFEMTKNVIKFSKKYPKLWEQTTAELLTVKDITIDENTNKDLLEYDTKALDGSYYELKKGKYIQLIFLGNKNIPFCTIRNAYGRYGDKKEYYQSKIGEVFNIVIVSESPKLPLEV